MVRRRLISVLAILMVGVGLSACSVGNSETEGEDLTGMKFTYTILYVPDMEAALAFYKEAFGIEVEYMHDSGQYAELKTGETRLGMADEKLARELGLDFRPSRADEAPPAFEIGFTVEDVDATYRRAVEAGAASVQEPTDMPWRQRVAYVRDPNGVHIVIATPPTH